MSQRAAKVPAGTLKKTWWQKLQGAVARTNVGDEATGTPLTDTQRMVAGLYPQGVRFSLPALPPGVLPREGVKQAVTLANDEIDRGKMAMDDWSGGDIGSWFNTSLAFGYFFQGYPYLAQLTQISEYRAPSEVLAAEMTRRWFKLKASEKKKQEEADADADGPDKADKQQPMAGDFQPEPEEADTDDPANAAKQELADKITEIEQCLEDMNVRACVRDCITQDGLFGRSQLFVRIKNQEDDATRQLPLLVENIAKGSLMGFKPIEPYWTTPWSYNAIDPTRADFYKPTSWYIMGKKTHATRLLMFLARPVPDLLKPSYNFGGISLTQLLEPAVNMWLRTRKSVNDLIHNFSITALKSNLAALLEDTAFGGLMARLKLFTNNRDNQGVMLLDKDTEELDQVNVPISGLDKLQAQAQEHMAAVCHMPLVVLTGVTPSGLNASSEGEIQVWHEYVASQQKVYDPNIKLIIEMAQMHLYGVIDDGITHEWTPLDEPTAKEKAEERKSDADRDGVYIDKGVLDPQEVRDKLAKDPTSGYDGLVGDAPGPPAPALDPNNLMDGDGPEDDDKPAKPDKFGG